MDETIEKARLAYESWRGHMISTAEASEAENRRRPDIARMSFLPRTWSDLPVHEQEAWRTVVLVLADPEEKKQSFADAIDKTVTLDEIIETMPEGIAEVREIVSLLRSEAATIVLDGKSWPQEFKNLLKEEALTAADHFNELANVLANILEGAKTYRSDA